MEKTLLSLNLSYLRKKKGLKQSDIQGITGIKQNTWSNWENSLSEPNTDNLILISRFFNIGVDDLLTKDLQKGNLNENEGIEKNHKKGNLKGNLTGNLNDDFKSFVREDQAMYERKKKPEEANSLQLVIATQNKLISALEAQIMLLEEKLKVK